MKQIYDFELYSPPIVNENTLNKKLEKRRLKYQTCIIAIAALLLQIAIIMLGVLTIETYPFLMVAGMFYVLVSIIGGSVIAAIYAGGVYNV